MDCQNLTMRQMRSDPYSDPRGPKVEQNVNVCLGGGVKHEQGETGVHTAG